MRKKYRRWTRSLILEGLRAAHAQGVLLNHDGVFKYDPALCDAAVRFFGNTRNAVEAAGLTYFAPEPWSAETVIKWLLQMREEGHELTPASVEKYSRALGRAARNYYPSTAAAIEEALGEVARCVPASILPITEEFKVKYQAGRRPKCGYF